MYYIYMYYIYICIINIYVLYIYKKNEYVMIIGITCECVSEHGICFLGIYPILEIQT